MLVLSRKRGETIVIDDCVRVTVEAIGESRVRLSIEAPAEVAVDREEIWQRKQRGARRRTATGSGSLP
jgi:carbon storage regulator